MMSRGNSDEKIFFVYSPENRCFCSQFEIMALRHRQWHKAIRSIENYDMRFWFIILISGRNIVVDRDVLPSGAYLLL